MPVPILISSGCPQEVLNLTEIIKILFPVKFVLKLTLLTSNYLVSKDAGWVSGSLNLNELVTPLILANIDLSMQKMGPLITLPSGVLELHQIMLY